MNPCACFFHRHQLITTFCMQKQCTLPLCQTCLKIHQNQHLHKNTQATIISIQQAYQNAVKGYKNLIENQEKIKQKLISQKQNVLKLVNDYYQLKQVIISKIFAENLQEDMRKAVQGSLKYLIKFYSQFNIKIQNLYSNMFQQFQNIISQNNNKTQMISTNPNIAHMKTQMVKEVQQNRLENYSPIYTFNKFTTNPQTKLHLNKFKEDRPIQARKLQIVSESHHQIKISSQFRQKINNNPNAKQNKSKRLSVMDLETDNKDRIFQKQSKISLSKQKMVSDVENMVKYPLIGHRQQILSPQQIKHIINQKSQKKILQNQSQKQNIIFSSPIKNIPLSLQEEKKLSQSNSIIDKIYQDIHQK